MKRRGYEYGDRRNQKREDRREMVFLTLAIIGILLLGVGAWVSMSYWEAKAFNRITGNEVSTLDAMFVTLRVGGFKECP